MRFFLWRSLPVPAEEKFEMKSLYNQRLPHLCTGRLCQLQGGAYGGKWRNDATGGVLNTITYSAAELYTISETEPDELHSMFDSDSFVETTDVSGMRADMFYEESEYTDDTIIAPLLNEDGTLAPHDRYLETSNGVHDNEISTVGSKSLIYILIKLQHYFCMGSLCLFLKCFRCFLIWKFCSNQFFQIQPWRQFDCRRVECCRWQYCTNQSIFII